MPEQRNGTLLMSITSEKDISAAIRKWPRLKTLGLLVNDQIWDINPPAPHMVNMFMVIRGEEIAFQCPLFQMQS